MAIELGSMRVQETYKSLVRNITSTQFTSVRAAREILYVSHRLLVGYSKLTSENRENGILYRADEWELFYENNPIGTITFFTELQSTHR
jgi:hypothetical protein